MFDGKKHRIKFYSNRCLVGRAICWANATVENSTIANNEDRIFFIKDELLNA
jgi:hypothetical protein